ncbi:MAG TPA: DUF1844 domain-containing protein [Candidatus Polarisedimenticolaceae bacterium]|nr:DUF1844 domain-containing protein [Candidatus Polarisedimenticolaceae bacterium]
MTAGTRDKDGETSDGRSEGEIKVTDRRLFTLDGELRQDRLNEKEASGSAAEPAPAAPRAPRREAPSASGEFERRALDEPAGVDFTMLLNAMAQPALLFLGEIPHPSTGQARLDLEQARLQIDMLDLLRVKCRGNLTAEEEGLLERILYQLRMLYLARSNQPAQL